MVCCPTPDAVPTRLSAMRVDEEGESSSRASHRLIRP